MKYEMIFGDEKLFDGVGLFTGVDIVTRNIDDGLYRSSKLSDSTPSSLRNNPVVAMRRIIAEPKRWTWEDKKAGRLPEVGCVVMAIDVNEVARIAAINNDSVCSVCVVFEDGDFITLHFSGIAPIETAAEKAQREEDEFVGSLAGADINYGTGTVKELFEQGARAAYRKMKGGE